MNYQVSRIRFSQGPRRKFLTELEWGEPQECLVVCYLEGPRKS